MKTRTCIGTMALALALLAGLAPRAEAAGYEMPITFSGYTNQSEALTNFPVLVVFSNGVGSSGFSFSSHSFVTTSGYDLRFYTNATDTGSGLNYEIESWNTNAASHVWVQVPLIPTNGMGSIYAKWGDTAASNQLACTTNGAVWTNGFAAVWHMGQTNAQDSTSNRNHGTSFANTNTTGFIGGAQGFNGSSAYIDVGNGTSVRIAGNKLTQSAWINPAANVAYGTILTKKLCYYFQRHNDQKLGAYPYTTSPAAYQYSTGTAPLNVWTHAAIVYDGSLVRFFLNGVESGNAARTGNMGSTADNLKIGWDTSASARYWNGLLDEVRLCGVARSTNWIWAEYQTMASNTAFSTYSAVSGGDTSSPQVQNRTPTGVATNGATFNGYLLTNGVSDASVYVLWGGTNGIVSPPWAYTNEWPSGDWTDGSYPATNMTLEADREYFYQFGATNSTTNVTASGVQYLITAKLTPTTSDGLCGPSVTDTATIAISRPGTLTNGALEVNYALSGSGTNYVSASPASGFTLAAGEASRNVVFTPVAWNTNAVATVTLTLLPGAYASNDLGSAQVSVTNATTLTAASDTLIGAAMAVIENPPDTVTPTVVGTATNYAFFGLNLDLNGKKIYYNTAQRNVVLTNLASVADSGAGSIDTSWGGATGYIELYSSGPVQIGGSLITKTTSGTAATGLIRVDGTNVRIGGSLLTQTPGNNANHSGSVTINAPSGTIGITNYVATFNDSTAGVWCQAGAVVMNAANVSIGGATNGLAIAAYGYGPQNKQGANVTLTATNGVTLSTGGIATYGRGGGAVTISDGAGGSAGDIYVGGNLLSYNNNTTYLPGTQTLVGASIRVTGYIDADQKGSGTVTPAFAPIAIVGSGSVRVDGYITASRTVNSGIMSGDHSVRLQGASVTVGGTSGGYSVLAMNACGSPGEKADNISLIATNGDITVAGGFDAYAQAGSGNYGYVTNIASGNITIGSLNAGRFKAITLMAGQDGGKWIYVSGALTSFTVSESPKKITFPTGSSIGNDIYCSAANNPTLSGEYAIFVSTTDTTKKLKVGPPTVPVIGQTSPMTVTMDEDGIPAGWPKVAGDLTATDSGGGTLTWSVSSAASRGTATVNGTGASPATFTYVPYADNNGSDSFVVKVTNPQQGEATITVNVTITPRNDAPVCTVVPVVSGDYFVGSQLSTGNGTWNDTKDITYGGSFSPTYTYQWQRANDSGGGGQADILPATSSTYTLTGADADKYVRVRVTCTDSGEGDPGVQSTQAFSTPWSLVVANNVAPTIDQTGPLTPSMDEDGIPAAWSAPTLTANDTDSGDNAILAWSVSSPASHGLATVNGTGTAPATFTYEPNGDYNGSDSFVVKVSDGKPAGDATITVNVTINARNDAPVCTVNPTHTFQAPDTAPLLINKTVTVNSDGTWNDTKDIQHGGSFSPTFTYQWQRANDSGGGGQADISSANGSSYTIVNADEQKWIRVAVTCTDNAVGTPAIANATAYSTWQYVYVSYNLRAASDTAIGSNMDVIENPPDTVLVAGANPYTYDFTMSSLNLNNYSIRDNNGARNVILTNLLAVSDSGVGSINTERAGATGYIELYSIGPVQVGGNLTTRNPGDATTGRIRVNATDIRVGGGVMTDNYGNGDNAGSITLTASAGDIAVSNAVASACHGGGAAAAAGAIALTAGRIAVGGTSAYGYAVDAHGGNAAGAHIAGNRVTLTATGGVTLATGGIATYGGLQASIAQGGGAVTISDGAGGSAGDITIGGNVLSYNNEEKSLPGAQTLIGANIRVTGYMDADQKGSGVVSPGLVPIVIQGSGSVRVDGYVTASRTVNSGVMTGDHSVRIQGASVTVGGTSGGYSVRTYNACVNDAAANISLIATAGDITVSGGYDAWSTNGVHGTVTNIASGNITIGSLDKNRFKAITLQVGGRILITGVITNFTVSESPTKKITFPAGSVIGNDIYYYADQNTAYPLSGDYAIWVGTDTGKLLKEQIKGSVFRFR